MKFGKLFDFVETNFFHLCLQKIVKKVLEIFYEAVEFVEDIVVRTNKNIIVGHVSPSNTLHHVARYSFSCNDLYAKRLKSDPIPINFNSVYQWAIARWCTKFRIKFLKNHDQYGEHKETYVDTKQLWDQFGHFAYNCGMLWANLTLKILSAINLKR